jgi:hypothetical protein
MPCVVSREPAEKSKLTERRSEARLSQMKKVSSGLSRVKSRRRFMRIRRREVRSFSHLYIDYLSW